MAFSNVGFAHIIDYINEGVLTGRFTEGERIPSVRDMAELMQVAPNTVVHAYDIVAKAAHGIYQATESQLIIGVNDGIGGDLHQFGHVAH